jgi:hypothetical protein
MPRIAGAFIVMAIVIAAVVIARSQAGAERPGKIAEMVSKQFAQAPRGSLRPEAVLAIAPGKSNTSTASVPRKLSPDFEEMLASPTFGPLFTRLSSIPARNAEQQWMLGRILYRCGRIETQRPSGTNASFKPPSYDEARAKFIASLDPDDPDYGKRVASFDAASWDRCEGVSEARVTHDEWRALLQSAADGGSPRAKVDLVRDDLLENTRARARSGQYGPGAIASEQVEALKQAVMSGDPYAIENGTDLMANPYGNFSLRDARGQVVDSEAFRDAGLFLACDAGYPCKESQRIQQACALVGQCAADNIRDFIMYYNASPYMSQQIAQYQQALGAAVARGDWSGFRFNPGPQTFPGRIR